jgi:ATP-dependent RNA helicase RhlE
VLFSDLGLNSRLLSALESAGYTTATPIQVQAIPPIVSGRDVLGSAQTGTGKTAAFALPALQRIAELKAASGSNKSVIRCLVLVPTRELAMQVNTSFNKYGRGGIGAPLRFAVAYGGVKQGKQVEALRSGVDVLVATPGRLEDLHQQGLVDLSNVALLILDEADQMLDMGFIIPIRRIAKLCPPPPPAGNRQTLMFSATMPVEIKRLATEMLRNFVEIHVAPQQATTELIDQQAFRIDSGSKSALLKHYLKQHNAWKTLVFTRTKHGADRVTRGLQKAGISAAAIHGNRSQPQRMRALEAFKKGDIAVLVATDVAARGLHISEVSHVINYDMPAVAETYVHRIGRTGRAGSAGTAVSFISGEDRGVVRDLERLLKKPLTLIPLPNLPELAPNARAHADEPADAEPTHRRGAGVLSPKPTRQAPTGRSEPKFYNNDRCPPPPPPAHSNRAAASDHPGRSSRPGDRDAFRDDRSYPVRRDDTAPRHGHSARRDDSYRTPARAPAGRPNTGHRSDRPAGPSNWKPAGSFNRSRPGPASHTASRPSSGKRKAWNRNG